jgi:predicted permease
MLQDLRYAVRTLRKAPLFTSVAVFSLALGIGANTAIFTLVNQIILQLLPVQHPEELVLLTARGRHYGSNNGANAISYPMYQDFRDKNQVFQGMFCKYSMDFSLAVDGRTEVISGELVSGNYFPLLGVGAALGRVFTAADDLYQGQHPLAVLSYGFWQSRFNSDPGVLGKRIIVNGYPLTIVGVSRAGFDGVEAGVSPQLRVPMMMKRELTNGTFYSLNERRGRFVQAFGRLRPGVDLQTAKAGLQPLFHQILNMEVQEKDFARATPYTKEQFLKMWMDVLPASKGRSNLRRQFANPLWALMAIVGLVLLIACSNVANLLIARATARQKEIAVRLAIGANRRQLIAQLLEESLLLSCVGGALGIGLAAVMDKTMLSFLPADTLPITVSWIPDIRVLLFTLAVSVLTGLIFGLIPALQATRPNLAGTLKDQAGAVVGGTSVRLRKGLVAAQVGLSLLLLIGAGLFVQSLKNLRNVNPGFQTESLVTFFVDPSLNGYKPERSREFYRQLIDRIDSTPGVKTAGLAIMPVLSGSEWDSSVAVEGYSAKQGENVGPHMNFISDGFFDALGIRVLAGRAFDLRDEQPHAAKVGVINETFAKRYFAGQSPVGRHVGMGGDPGTKLDIEIVGVVQDTKYEDMRTEVPYELYRPYRQVEFTIGMNAYVRAQGDPAGLFPALRQAVRETDANVPIVGLRTLQQQVDQSLTTERMLATLSAIFGLLATVLAAVGLYGVMAYMVALRTREIGIRMALGAGRPAVVWLIMREVMLLAGVGIAIGAPAAWFLSRLVESQLFGVKPADPPTILLAMIGIGAVAAISGYLPARRATGIDPIRALRWE